MALGRRAHLEITRHEFGKRGDARPSPRHAGADIDLDITDPVELFRHEQRGLVLPQGFEDGITAKGADGGAIFGGGIEQLVGSDETIGPGNIGGHNRRIAGNMLSDEIGNQPAVKVRAAPGGRPNIHCHALALIEISDTVRARRNNPTYQ